METKEVICWNFDFQDPDNILRIEAEESITLNIVKLLTINGIVCEKCN